jgi:hypothetical protein
MADSLGVNLRNEPVVAYSQAGKDVSRGHC